MPAASAARPATTAATLGVAKHSVGNVASFDFFDTGLSAITISGVFSSINLFGGADSSGVLTGCGSFDARLADNTLAASTKVDLHL